MSTTTDADDSPVEPSEPAFGFKNVVGLEEQKAKLRDQFVSGVDAGLFGGPTGHHLALIRGPIGANTDRLATGLADAIADNGFEYYHFDSPPFGAELMDRVEEAADNPPAVIQIDVFDEFTDAELDRFRELHDGVRARGDRVVFIAVSKCVVGHGVIPHWANADSVRSDDITVTVPTLDGSRRVDLLRHILAEAGFDANDVMADEQWATIEDITEDFHVNDIHKVASRVAVHAAADSDQLQAREILDAAREVREEAQHLTDEDEEEDTEADAANPDVTYDDIGGLDDTIERLKAQIERPLTHSERYESLGLSVDTGAILYGPPGTGKTLLAKAFANETDRYFVHIDGNAVTSKWYGESEENLHQFFEEARENAPSLVFIDELDSIAPERGSTEGPGADERIVAQLLRELDGLESLEDVFVLGATNRPDRVDDALLRSGRLGDEHIEVLPPEETEAQAEIFGIHLRERPTTDDLTPEWAAEQVPGRPSGSFIENICDKAAQEAVWPPDDQDPVISRADFEAAIDDVRHFWEDQDSPGPTYH